MNLLQYSILYEFPSNKKTENLKAEVLCPYVTFILSKELASGSPDKTSDWKTASLISRKSQQRSIFKIVGLFQNSLLSGTFSSHRREDQEVTDTLGF